MNKELHQRLFGDWTPEDGGSKTDAFFNKLFKDIEEGKFIKPTSLSHDEPRNTDRKVKPQTA